MPAFLAVVIAVAAWAVAQENAPPEWGGPIDPNAETIGGSDGPKQTQMREGTELLDQAGYFRLTGTRVTFFYGEENDRLIGLENLNLQRIAQTISDNPANPSQLVWQVSGTVTEYQGDNYLLITRAVLVPGDEDAN